MSENTTTIRLKFDIEETTTYTGTILIDPEAFRKVNGVEFSLTAYSPEELAIYLKNYELAASKYTDIYTEHIEENSNVIDQNWTNFKTA